MVNVERYYLGKEEILLNDESKEKLVHRLRQYLDLRNVSLLIGNGASMPFGAPKIGNVAEIKEELKKEHIKLEEVSQQKSAMALLDLILKEVNDALNIEAVLSLLSHLEADLDMLGTKSSLAINDKSVSSSEIQALDRLLKKWLYFNCKKLSIEADDDTLKYHRELFRRFLLRSTSLPRLKIFTTNYDLLIEQSLDSLGVAYFDGFLGTTLPF